MNKDGVLVTSDQHKYSDMSKLKEEGPGCEHTKRGDAHGPMRFVIKRKHRPKVGEHKVVCQFSVSVDMFMCAGAPWNCCAPWAHNYPRFTTSDYKPQEQTTGHDCKNWYVNTLIAANAIIGVTASMQVNTQMKYCNKDDCDRGEYCNKATCDSNKLKVKDKCRWVEKRDRWHGRRRVNTEARGYCGGSLAKGITKQPDENWTGECYKEACKDGFRKPSKKERE
jgi:hypothetical protein